MGESHKKKQGDLRRSAFERGEVPGRVELPYTVLQTVT